MIIILNGSVGVGKTSVAWALNESLGKSVMLDGDYIGAVHPFEIYDDARVDHLYRTLAHLIKFHIENGYTNFVINYVFESPELLAALVKPLRALDKRIYTFWLTCLEDEQRGRILKRRTDGWKWELERFVELNAILEAASERGDIGVRVDTTGKSVADVVRAIREATAQHESGLTRSYRLRQVNGCRELR